MAKKEMEASEGTGARKVTHPHALTPFEEMERMFGSVFPPARIRPSQWEWPSWAEMSSFVEEKVPKLDIIERDNEVIVRAEVAGVDKKDLDISVTDHTVTIKGCTKEEHKEEKGDYFRSEISQGSFSRTSTLPCDVDGDKARASFSDGILELTIPKLATSKRHTIKVE
ncbi:MAG TPA: Hsp20/alpha crystallin family protein [Gammaproteobacteria bacterium]|nr:Hsp20/alpha crystallin family protein [Gammaproteobacteria bacterium]